MADAFSKMTVTTQASPGTAPADGPALIQVENLFNLKLIQSALDVDVVQMSEFHLVDLVNLI